MKNAVGQNARPQTAAASQKFLRSGRDCAVHPVTRPTFLSPAKPDALNFEIFAYQTVKINAANENVSPQATRFNALELQRTTQLIENVEGKERDLSLVILFVIEVAISAQPAPGDAFNRRKFDHREVVRFTTVMSFEIMAGRDVKMTDFHRAE